MLLKCCHACLLLNLHSCMFSPGERRKGTRIRTNLQGMQELERLARAAGLGWLRVPVPAAWRDTAALRGQGVDSGDGVGVLPVW